MPTDRIEIITIGDELVEGRLVDTNSAAMSDILLLHGLSVAAHHSVADVVADIAAALQSSAERSTAVLVSGGLGPTSDDLTAAAAAQAFNLPIQRFPEALDHARSFFTRRGRTMPPANSKQADLPAGATILPNPWGTAVGFSLEVGACRISFMPGVPRELAGIFEATVLPQLLADAQPNETSVATLKLFGIGESDAAQRLGDLASEIQDPDQLLIQYRATFPEIHLRLVLRSSDEVALQNLVDTACERLGHHVFAIGDGRLKTTYTDVVLAELQSRDLTVAVADAASDGHLGLETCSSELHRDRVATSVQAPSTEALAKSLGVNGLPESIEKAAPILAAAAANLASTDLAVACLCEPLDGNVEGIRLWVCAGDGESWRTRSREILLDRTRSRKLAAWVALTNLRRYLND